MRTLDLGRTFDEMHELGLFPRAAWLQWMREAGFEPSSRLDPWNRDVFLGLRYGLGARARS